MGIEGEKNNCRHAISPSLGFDSGAGCKISAVENVMWAEESLAEIEAVDCSSGTCIFFIKARFCKKTQA